MSVLVLLGGLSLRLLEYLSLRRMLAMMLLNFMRLIELVLWLILQWFLIRGQRLDVLGAFVCRRSGGSTSLLAGVSSAGISFSRPSRLGKQLGLRSVDVLVVLLPLSLSFRICYYPINPFV